MMKKLGIPLGKTLVTLGTCLAVFVAVEAHQKMVDALTLDNTSPQAPARTQGGGGSFNPQSVLGNARPDTPATASSHVALNAGDPGAPAQHLAQVDPDQFAYSEWAGASFPVENFQAYTSPFGYRESPTGYNYQEFHYGLDMAAPEGSYIRNWWSGKVVEVSDDSNCGTSVVVESGQWLHIYCHMQGHVEAAGGKRYMIDREGGVQIFEGQEIEAGHRIGRVGMTGRTTGPHLHWGMKYDNNWVDPALVLRAMYGTQQQQASGGSRRVARRVTP